MVINLLKHYMETAQALQQDIDIITWKQKVTRNLSELKLVKGHLDFNDFEKEIVNDESAKLFGDSKTKIGIVLIEVLNALNEEVLDEF